MIKGLTGDAYITVTGGNTSVPYINTNPNNPMQGMIRINGSDMQVFDGTMWTTMNTSYASLTLSPTYQSVLYWAMQKMQDEREIINSAKKHPAVKIALDNLEKAKQQLDVTIILSKEHNDTTTTS
jgi:hypothetical protein